MKLSAKLWTLLRDPRSRGATSTCPGWDSLRGVSCSMACRQRVQKWVCDLVEAEAAMPPEIEGASVSCWLACRQLVHRWFSGLVRAQSAICPEIVVSTFSCCRKGDLAVQRAAQGLLKSRTCLHCHVHLSIDSAMVVEQAMYVASGSNTKPPLLVQHKWMWQSHMAMLQLQAAP